MQSKLCDCCMAGISQLCCSKPMVSALAASIVCIFGGKESFQGNKHLFIIRSTPFSRSRRHLPIALEMAVSIAVKAGENEFGVLMSGSNCWQQNHEGDCPKGIPEYRELVDQPQYLDGEQA